MVSDAARRVADEYNLHRVAAAEGSIGQWIACSLADGYSDHVLYASKRAAVAHQHHNEQYYMFVQIVPTTMSAEDAEILLKTHRALYDHGLRMADPDSNSGGRDMIKRVSREDQANQLRALFRGDRKPSNIIYPRG